MGRALALAWVVAALAAALPAGARAQECSDDSDCGDGFECELGPSAGVSSSDCDPESGSCDAAPAPEPEPRTGECEPAELRCQTDADCPSGARCSISDDDCDSSAPASGSDSGGQAGAPAPVPPEEIECEQASEGQCVFTLTECTQDSQCQGDDECTAFDSQTCEGGGSSATPTCVGNNCPAPEPQPEPEEDSCQVHTISYCFPPIVDCSDGEACPDATRCVELEEDIREDAPPAFQGASALCLPEAWALGLEGRIELDGGRSSSAEDSATSAGRGQAKSDNDLGDDSAAKGSGDQGDDDCAVRAPGSRRSRALWPLLGATLLGLGYRRRRARRARH
jgi:hypothetical protein